MFADSTSRAQELSNDVSFVIFGHKNMGFRAGTPAGIGLKLEKYSPLKLKKNSPLNLEKYSA